MTEAELKDLEDLGHMWSHTVPGENVKTLCAEVRRLTERLEIAHLETKEWRDAYERAQQLHEKTLRQFHHEDGTRR